MRSERGISLMETMLVLAIMAILSGIAVMNSTTVDRQRVGGVIRSLLADLQRARQDAMTRSTPPPAAVASRGAGIRFVSATQYVAFEFNDLDSDYTYDGVAEELAGSQRPSTLSGGLSLTLGGANPTNTVFIFDRQGMPRDITWGFATALGNLQFVVQAPRLPVQPKCVVLSQTWVREGTLDGGGVCVPS